MGQLLVLSDRQIDIGFWTKIAHQEGLRSTVSVEISEIQKILEEAPDSLILWDGECEKLRGVERLLAEKSKTDRVFVVTDGPARRSPHLFMPLSFAHHLNRRYDKTAEFLCSVLLKRSIQNAASGFQDYFRDVAYRKTMTLSRSYDKHHVLQDFYGAMLDQGIPERIADIGTDAADELLMNALFDAPTNEHAQNYRRLLQRDADFELTGKEVVQADLMIDRNLIGIRVLDQFGSLSPESATRCLAKNFEFDDYVPSDADPGAGLGIVKLVKSTLSLDFFVNPGVSTESVALLGNAKSVREFRNSFCFFSVQSLDPKSAPK